VNMCYAMIIAFPRSDSMYDPVIRAMKVPSYRNFSFFYVCASVLTHTHTHTRTRTPVSMPVCVSAGFICETAELIFISGV
jgi:hypothetical protein